MITQEITTLFIAPNELRKIADQLEEGMKKAKWGDVLPHRNFSSMGNTKIIRLQVDQQRFEGGD